MGRLDGTPADVPLFPGVVACRRWFKRPWFSRNKPRQGLRFATSSTSRQLSQSCLTSPDLDKIREKYAPAGCVDTGSIASGAIREWSGLVERLRRLDAESEADACRSCLMIHRAGEGGQLTAVAGFAAGRATDQQSARSDIRQPVPAKTETDEGRRQSLQSIVARPGESRDAHGLMYFARPPSPS